MEISTIQLSKETKEKISSFGVKGESYDAILKRIYSLAVKEQIKELKYKSFRFYFITDGHKLKFIDKSSLVDLLIRFVRMSDKKDQQETINEIRKILEIGR